MKTKTNKILLFFLASILISTLSFGQKYDDEGFAVSNSISGPKYGNDSINCVTQLSLYRENYRQWRSSNFESDAILYTVDSWRHVFLNCPLASQNTFIDGTKIIEYLYNKAETPELKQAYVDTLMLMYDTRIMAFGNEGFVLGRKAADLLSYKPEDFPNAFPMFSRAIKTGGNETESAVVFYYFVTTVRMVRELGEDEMMIFDNYDIAISIVEHNIKRLKAEIENNPAEADKNQRVLGGYESALNNIESLFEPFATCEKLEAMYSVKYEANPQDTVLLEKMIAAFDRKNCTPPIYFTAAEELYKLKPSASSAFSLGRMYYRQEEYSKSIPFLQDAVSGLEDNDMKADAYYFLADAYKNLRNYSAARTNALKVTELRPNDGKPWILIGDLYAMSAASCGDNPVTSKAAYWVAVDKYQRARSVDESVAQTANSRIASYSGAFPKSEDLFFHGFKVGDTYRVECWINETTTVRSSD